MNKIKEFNIGDKKGIFVSVPYSFKNFKIEQFNRAGTWIKETDSKNLNSWKTNIPKGNYEVLGHTHNVSEYLIEQKLGLCFTEYLKFLNGNNIVVNYSDNSDLWLILLSNAN